MSLFISMQHVRGWDVDPKKVALLWLPGHQQATSGFWMMSASCGLGWFLVALSEDSTFVFEILRRYSQRVLPSL